jgi:hypothetical protein
LRSATTSTLRSLMRTLSTAGFSSTRRKYMYAPFADQFGNATDIRVSSDHFRVWQSKRTIPLNILPGSVAIYRPSNEQQEYLRRW